MPPIKANQNYLLQITLTPYEKQALPLWAMCNSSEAVYIVTLDRLLFIVDQIFDKSRNVIFIPLLKLINNQIQIVKSQEEEFDTYRIDTADER